MLAAVKFPFVDVHPALGAAGKLPLMPFSIEHQGVHLDIIGLVDSGATINVFPYDVGAKLGADWNLLTPLPQLAGNLANYLAKALLVEATIGTFKPVKLAFAWSKDPDCPILMGQMNFFAEFDVCFHHSQSYFEVALKP
jgi:hypothetical protein